MRTKQLSNKLTNKEIFDWLQNNNAVLEKITNKIALEYHNNFKDREDIKSLVYMNAARILKTYDKSKNTKIITFIMNYAGGRAREEYYKSKSIVSVCHNGILKHGILDYKSLNDKHYTDDIDETIDFISDEATDPREVDNSIDTKNLVNNIFEYSKKRLSPKQSYVLRQRYSKGRTIEDISKEMGVSMQRVSQLEHRALDKVKGVYNNDKYRIY